MKAIYRDSLGEEHIEFRTSGSELSTTIRGVQCTGPDFNALEPAASPELFELSQGCVCGCKFTLDIPVRLLAPEGLRHVDLRAEVGLSSGGEDIVTSLQQAEFSIRSRGDSGWFEFEMISLSEQLPAGFSLQCCLTCGLSDYSPFGHGAFGDLACFRDAAEDYRDVRGKGGIFKLWPRLTKFVQETHYCPQYETRPKGRGYRG